MKFIKIKEKYPNAFGKLLKYLNCEKEEDRFLEENVIDFILLNRDQLDDFFENEYDIFSWIYPNKEYNKLWDYSIIYKNHTITNINFTSKDNAYNEMFDKIFQLIEKSDYDFIILKDNQTIEKDTTNGGSSLVEWSFGPTNGDNKLLLVGEAVDKNVFPELIYLELNVDEENEEDD